MNKDLASLLYEVADIMEMQEVQWKPRAYRAAARTIENLSENIADIYRKKGRKGLQDIPRIGESLAKHIEEYIETGTVKKWDAFRKTDLHTLMDIMGLGPRKVKQLYQELGIMNIEDLKEAVEKRQVRDLEGFGEKTEENLLHAIHQYELSLKRMLLGKAWDLAYSIVEHLKSHVSIEKVDVAGSIRRMKETIGDIDILVITHSKEIMDVFAGMPDVSRIIAKGTTKTTVQLNDGTHVDLRAINHESYGAALQYFTGSKDHNIAMRTRAGDRGYKLSEYGLFEGSKRVASSEPDIYKALDLAWIPPELRENRGEFQVPLPTLVEMRDISGDLHIHSDFSDGIATIQDMAQKAKDIGYEYLAITDHSPSTGGLSPDQLNDQWKEIDSIRGIRVLKGAEVDILPDGSLDYDNELLSRLDIVLVAIHSRFRIESNEMTRRILKALDNPHVNVLSHPTGRIIYYRDPIKADFDAIYRKCADKHIALEINANPSRLDLNDKQILAAKKHGVKFTIGTDAHVTPALDNMRFGIGQARRGWLEKTDILNCMTYKQLMRWLHGKSRAP
ncbi:MAG: DNA polymerase/3'-5' exonuclease PolX [Nanobdellota archaeon]